MYSKCKFFDRGRYMEGFLVEREEALGTLCAVLYGAKVTNDDKLESRWMR